MNRKLLAAAAVALLGIASPSWASPVTIDFDAFSVPVFSQVPFSSGSEDGFTLTATHASLASLSLLVPGFSQPNYIVTDTTNTGNFVLTLVESDASAFEFLGLEGGNAGTSASLTVRGFQGATLVGTDVFNVSTSGSGFNASVLSGLALTKIEIEGQFVSGLGISAFADDIRLETDATISAVPEPGTLALAGLAVAGLGLSRRRRAS